MYEVEQKFKVDSFDAVEAALHTLRAEAGAPVSQHDTYYAHPARDFAVTDEALRLRKVGEQVFITYKGPKVDATTKTRRELELELPEGDATFTQMDAILTALGFAPVTTVRKLRQSWRLPWEQCEVELSLDEVERLGRYVELELAAPEDALAAARSSLASLAERLNLDRSERRSYLELLLDEYAS